MNTREDSGPLRPERPLSSRGPSHARLPRCGPAGGRSERGGPRGRWWGLPAPKDQTDGGGNGLRRGRRFRIPFPPARRWAARSQWGAAPPGRDQWEAAPPRGANGRAEPGPARAAPAPRPRPPRGGASSGAGAAHPRGGRSGRAPRPGVAPPAARGVRAASGAPRGPGPPARRAPGRLPPGAMVSPAGGAGGGARGRIKAVGGGARRRSAPRDGTGQDAPVAPRRHGLQPANPAVVPEPPRPRRQVRPGARGEGAGGGVAARPAALTPLSPQPAAPREMEPGAQAQSRRPAPGGGRRGPREARGLPQARQVGRRGRGRAAVWEGPAGGVSRGVFPARLRGSRPVTRWPSPEVGARRRSGWGQAQPLRPSGPPVLGWEPGPRWAGWRGSELSSAPARKAGVTGVSLEVVVPVEAPGAHWPGGAAEAQGEGCRGRGSGRDSRLLRVSGEQRGTEARSVLGLNPQVLAATEGVGRPGLGRLGRPRCAGSCGKNGV